MQLETPNDVALDMADAELARTTLLSAKGATCAAARNGKTMITHERGVKPLLQWISEGRSFEGWSVADKVVGKAPALLYVQLKPTAVFATALSEDARGILLENGIASRGVRRTYEGASPESQMFSETESQVQAGGRAHWLCASFSSYKDTAFTYDAGSQAYLVGQFGEAQMDGAYNTQVARQNVLALYIPTYSPDGGLLQQMDLIGSGDGYYMSRGKIIPIAWHKDSYDTPFYYTTEAGEALIMAPGSVYVCCVPLSGSITFE